MLEIAIGAYAMTFPWLLGSFETSYATIYRDYFESLPLLYHGFRVLVTASTLLIPTLLMGATLPLIVQQFADRDDVLGKRVGQFYAINTLGALLGTLGLYLFIAAAGERQQAPEAGLRRILGRLRSRVGRRLDRASDTPGR